MIKNIIFDIGNVLVHFRPEKVMAELGMDGETVKAVMQATAGSPLWSELDRGVMSEAEVVALMKQHAAEAYRGCIDLLFEKGKADLVRSYPYAAPWLRELRGRGYKVYLLSNYPKDIFELHARLHFTFLPYVDGKIVSGYVKVIKPDPAIYRILLDTYHLEADECAFLDDMEPNVVAAEKLGIHALRFISYEDARQKLEALLSL